MSRLRTTSYVGDPRVKPPYGSVEVDWGHTLANGLIFYAPFNESAGLPVNLAQPDQANALIGSWGRSASGAAIKTSASGDYLRFPSSAKYLLEGNIAFTIAWKFDQTGRAATGADGFVANRSANSAGMWELYDDGANLAALSNTGWSGTLGPRPTLGLHTVVVSRAIGGSFTAWIDGAENGTFSNAGTGASSDSHTLVMGAIGSDASTNNIFGSWFWVGVWRHHAFSATEARQIHFEPYAFLRPIIRRRYFIFTPAAAAGNIFTQEHIDRGIGRGILVGR